MNEPVRSPRALFHCVLALATLLSDGVSILSPAASDEPGWKRRPPAVAAVLEAIRATNAIPAAGAQPGSTQSALERVARRTQGAAANHRSHAGAVDFERLVRSLFPGEHTRPAGLAG